MVPGLLPALVRLELGTMFLVHACSDHVLSIDERRTHGPVVGFGVCGLGP